MELTEHIANFLRTNGFAGATSGVMPHEPDRITAVFATGVKKRQDSEGSRFQIIVRSEPDNDTALSDAMRIEELLDDFSGITSIESPYFSRIVSESGVSKFDVDEKRRVLYSLNFRAWYC